MTQQAQPPPAGVVIGRPACRRPLARRVLASHWGGLSPAPCAKSQIRGVWTRGRYARSGAGPGGDHKPPQQDGEWREMTFAAVSEIVDG